MAGQVLATVAGTIALSALFGVPGEYDLYCGLIGGVGWMAYSFFAGKFGSAVGILLATMAVVFISRLAAIWKRCPVTIFLVSGIVPLVPGVGIYWMAYDLVTDQLALAARAGYEALKMAAAIVLGIVLVFELPQGLFQALLGKNRRGRNFSGELLDKHRRKPYK